MVPSTKQAAPRLASLTDTGLAQFKKLLSNAAGLELDLVKASIVRIASSSKLSSPLEPTVEVDLFPVLKTRHDTAIWVDGLLSGTGIEAGAGTGTERMFSWLAMVALPALCEQSKHGRLTIRDLARYVQSRRTTNFYRHLVAAPYWMHKKYGDRARIFLCQKASVMPDVQEQIVSRYWLSESAGVMEVIDRLYWDVEKSAPKDGFTMTHRVNDPPRGMPTAIPQPGTLRALESILGQMQCTHDLQTMSADQILERLPAEFDAWLT